MNQTTTQPIPGTATGALRDATAAYGKPPFLQVRGLEKRFGERTVLHDVSFEVQRGEVFALLGTNGAGKTTIAHILQGTLAPDAGDIRWAGVGGQTPTIGYFPEEWGGLANLSSRKALVHKATRNGMSLDQAAAQAEEWLHRVGLRDQGDLAIRLLSRGNQHRITFAAAALLSPQVLFLDEPCLGLDPLNQELFASLIRFLRSVGTTVLLSDHNLDWVQRLSDRYCILHEGRVVEGGTLPEMRERVAPGVHLLIRLREGVEMPMDKLARLDIHHVEPLTSTGYRIVLPESGTVDIVKQSLRGFPEVAEFFVEAPSLYDLYMTTIRQS